MRNIVQHKRNIVESLLKLQQLQSSTMSDGNSHYNGRSTLCHIVTPVGMLGFGFDKLQMAEMLAKLVATNNSTANCGWRCCCCDPGCRREEQKCRTRLVSALQTRCGPKPGFKSLLSKLLWKECTPSSALNDILKALPNLVVLTYTVLLLFSSLTTSVFASNSPSFS